MNSCIHQSLGEILILHLLSLFRHTTYSFRELRKRYLFSDYGMEPYLLFLNVLDIVLMSYSFEIVELIVIFLLFPLFLSLYLILSKYILEVRV